MSSFLRRGAFAVAGLAMMLGTGGTAFASGMDAPANGGTPGTPVQCSPTRPADPDATSAPANPIQGQPTKPVPVGTPSAPANRFQCSPTRPADPDATSAPAKPIGHTK